MNTTTGNATQSPQYRAEYSGGPIIPATTVLLICATGLLAARFYSRHLTAVSRGWDEFILIPAYVFFLGYCICNYVAVTVAQTGFHADVYPERIAPTLQIIYASELMYPISIVSSRLSILALYLRVFPLPAERRWCWAVIIWLLGFLVAELVTPNVQCVPLERSWNLMVPGYCINIPLWWKLTNVPNIIVDLIILAIPARTVLRLQATNGRKFGIYLVFLTGLMGLVASCVRLGLFSTYFTEDDPSKADATFITPNLLLWTMIEIAMYFCSACLIGLRPLLKRINRWIAERTGRYKAEGTIKFPGDTNYRAAVEAVKMPKTSKVSRGRARRKAGSTDSDILVTSQREEADNASGGSSEAFRSNSDIPEFLPPDRIYVKTTVDIESQQMSHVSLPIMRPD